MPFVNNGLIFINLGGVCDKQLPLGTGVGVALVEMPPV